MAESSLETEGRRWRSVASVFGIISLVGCAGVLLTRLFDRSQGEPALGPRDVMALLLTGGIVCQFAAVRVSHLGLKRALAVVGGMMGTMLLFLAVRRFWTW